MTACTQNIKHWCASVKLESVHHLRNEAYIGR